MSVSYDVIGINYSKLRKPDPDCRDHSERAGVSAEIVERRRRVRAYEPTDRSVIAVEPSAEMIRKRGPMAAQATGSS